MKTIVLTGANRGLGRALHALLLSPEFAADKKIFITRQAIPVEERQLVDYLILNLATLHIDTSIINIEPNSKYIIFINNAGVIDPIVNAAKIEPAEAEAAMRVNCWSPLQIAQYLSSKTKSLGIPLFIINVTSGAAKKPIRGWLAYCVSKAAAQMALDVLSEENSHINVLHFDPGVMETGMQEAIRATSHLIMPDIDKFLEYKNTNKLKEPSTVANNIGKIIQGNCL